MYIGGLQMLCDDDDVSLVTHNEGLAATCSDGLNK